MAAWRWLLALLLALAAGCSSAAGHAEAAAALSHDTGLRELSGKSLRAFKNRVRRQLRGADCLSHHEAGHWWRYEWCLDRHVRQFHSAKEAKEVKEAKETKDSVLLGSFRADSARAVRVERVGDFAHLADPDAAGYAAVERYSGDGNYCEAAGRPRRVQIRYVCCAFRTNETYIERVEEAGFGTNGEAAVCDYTVRVCSPAACGLVQRDAYALNAPMHVARDEQLALAQTVKDMFYHAYRGYLAHAFPRDDLAPLSCKGADFELGKIPMLTLIDTLDTLALLDDAIEFRRAVELVVARANFNLDTHVSVFETTIRVLGGLLSAHMLAVDTERGMYAKGEYNDELLTLAKDVADRLMPAFNTPTGIPYGTVNLRHGVPKRETTIASTAGAGSLALEFTMMSVLTEDPQYAVASRRAVRALFDRRSPLGLLGKHIDTKTGEWTETSSGPGSNSDSFYEYLLKMYALFGDRESLEMFATVYPAVLEHNLHGDWYTDVSMWSGCRNMHSNQVIAESLAAFWPGMQVGAGHLHSAANSMNAMYRVWREHGFFPEQFDVREWRPVRSNTGNGHSARYPLRPELIESTFYMHEATNDSSWLRAGAHFVHSLQKYAKTDCGYASIVDVERKKQEDYMPSFFLSETCKYLYLLFNTTHFVRQGGYVMTTEAHPFPLLPNKLVAPILEAGNKHVPLELEHFPNDDGLQCLAPTFSDRVSYSVDYDSKVVVRTPRCVASSNAKQRAKQAKKTGAGSLASGFNQWLPAIEAKLRRQFDFLYRNKAESSVPEIEEDEGGESDSEMTEPNLIPFGKAVYLPVEENMPVREVFIDENGVEHEDWLYQLLHGAGTPIPMEAASDAGHANLVDGGHHIGKVEVTQREGAMLFTRSYTGDWIEIAGIADALHLLVSIGIGTSAISSSSGERPDSEWLPSLQPTYHVYKLSSEGDVLPKSARCTINIAVSSEGPGSSDDMELSYPCVTAGFGIADFLDESRQFPLASLVMAEPRDGCEPLRNDRESVEGAVILVSRGDCFFESKVQNAYAAGAVGVIVFNNVDDAQQVMVMGGSVPMDDANTHADEDESDHAGSGEGESASSQMGDGISDKDLGSSGSSGDSGVTIPAVMIARGVGEWLERSLLVTTSESPPRNVRASISIAIRDRDHRLPADTVIYRGEREFPYVEATVSDRLRVYGPEWGVQLVATGAGDTHMSYAVAVFETPQAPTED